MRIVTAKELSKMPDGVIYSEWQLCSDSGLYAKDGDVTPAGGSADWWELSLLPEPCEGGNPKAADDEVQMPDGCFRWVGYDDSATFVVYEPADLVKLAEAVRVAIDVTPHPYQPFAANGCSPSKE